MSEKQPKPLVPLVISILALIAWVIFLLWFTLYKSPDFNLFQNVIITLGSLVLVGLAIGLMWVMWGFTSAGWTFS